MTIETAATLVPASATSNAVHAITIDGVGLSLRKRFMARKVLLLAGSGPRYPCLFGAEQRFTSLSRGLLRFVIGPEADRDGLPAPT
jgi:hypothetical protein